jgi:hypothetical protein
VTADTIRDRKYITPERADVTGNRETRNSYITVFLLQAAGVLHTRIARRNPYSVCGTDVGLTNVARVAIRSIQNPYTKYDIDRVLAIGNLVRQRIQFSSSTQ